MVSALFWRAAPIRSMGYAVFTSRSGNGLPPESTVPFANERYPTFTAVLSVLSAMNEYINIHSLLYCTEHTRFCQHFALSNCEEFSVLRMF
jgi:hypothetical protein